MSKKSKKNKGKSDKPAYLLDIVILVYGAWDLALEAYQSVVKDLETVNEKVRVIVVDNGTPDEEGMPPARECAMALKEAIAVRQPHDRFYRSDESKGFPAGSNYGANRGKAPLIFFMNSDVVLHPGAISAMIKELDNPAVGTVGMKLLFPENSKNGPPGSGPWIQHAGMFQDIDGEIRHAFLGWDANHWRVNQRREMCAVTGAALMTRRSLFDSLGGFAELYGMGTYEDIEYCFLTRANNLLVVFTPDAVGIHKVGGSSSDGPGQGFNLVVNKSMFISRWQQNFAWDGWKYY